MDALEVLMNKDKIIPYFQPIVSATKQRVMGYEILGRIQLGEEVISLGDFFNNDSIPDEYLIEIDEYIQEIAFDYYCQANQTAELFINCSANIMMSNQDYIENFLQRLKTYETRGLTLNKIVLEIKEHTYNGDLSQLGHLILYLKSLGIKIAIDDVGRGGSNLDRIAQLEPDILKVDLNFLKGVTISQVHRDVLYSLATFARKMGATLLFEGIGDLTKLNAAWRNGGRFYQGFYLALPAPNFVEENNCKNKLQSEFQQFINHERMKLTNQYNFTEELNTRLEPLINKKYSIDDLLKVISKSFSDLCFRLYICDQYGFQRSSNYVKINSSWEKQEDYIGKNWSWRPYFLENIIRMHYDKRGILSDIYADIDTNEFIRTFSFPINEELYLFLDIPYTVLYEKKGLLY
ncbi:EAL domain-containing protein [Anaerobacillus alkaliphilus]|uniref:EAL domain-containing protein n=1 Tax=Anaerobacillus alkaliphilus TaxID=1548597 RepID=A0A4Q0VPP4_9BACI|nr:EAL domain-containing protein [Anaerobacillus alkaliphilus]RXI97857.1 EAL domain-containing protein [Anaerobacillus alkaliphilus]